MTRLILDSGAIDRLADEHPKAPAVFAELKNSEFWPPLVPTVVLVECLTGRQHDDARTNRFIKTCELLEELPEGIGRRAADLRTRAEQGSVVDAILVALAEPGGFVMTNDQKDIGALASQARNATHVSTMPQKRRSASKVRPRKRRR